jgi:hypothetical protein
VLGRRKDVLTARRTRAAGRRYEKLDELSEKKWGELILLHGVSYDAVLSLRRSSPQLRYLFPS